MESLGESTKQLTDLQKRKLDVLERDMDDRAEDRRRIARRDRYEANRAEAIARQARDDRPYDVLIAEAEERYDRMMG